MLYDYIIENHLSNFNNEAYRRNTKWKMAKTADDLTLMKESDFLDVLMHISLIGKGVKKELKICLDLRNSCGHPDSLIIDENRVAAHLEILALNVFAVFS